MRTTINLSDALFAQVKRLAAQSGTTVTALIEEALRERLARRRKRSGAGRANLTTFGRGGLLPGVDLDDTATLLDLTEPSDVPDRR